MSQAIIMGWRHHVLVGAAVFALLLLRSLGMMSHC
jgi:hypothetical protein